MTESGQTPSSQSDLRPLDLPTALILDLDDTILDAYRGRSEAWVELCHEFAGRLGVVAPEELHAAVLESAEWVWSDPERARQARLNLREGRRQIVQGAFARLGIPAAPIADTMANRFTTLRERAVKLFPGAIDTLRHLGKAGVRLGLLTNGQAESQRGKIERFGLEPFFHHVQIEEEFGVGKPDERAFQHALVALGVGPNEAWMVGDNLANDILGAQQAGIYAVWLDASGHGVPDSSVIRPDRIIGSLPELLG